MLPKGYGDDFDSGSALLCVFLCHFNLKPPPAISCQKLRKQRKISFRSRFWIFHWANIAICWCDMCCRTGPCSGRWAYCCVGISGWRWWIPIFCGILSIRPNPGGAVGIDVDGPLLCGCGTGDVRTGYLRPVYEWEAGVAGDEFSAGTPDNALFEAGYVVSQQAHARGMIERIDGDVANLANFFSQFVMRIVGSIFLLSNCAKVFAKDLLAI